MSNKEISKSADFHYISPDEFLNEFIVGLKEHGQIGQEVVEVIKKHLASGHMKSNAGDELADDLKALAIGDE